MSDALLVLFLIVNFVLVILYVTFKKSPWRGPSIDDIRVELSNIKKSMKGTETLQKGMSLSLQVNPSSWTYEIGTQGSSQGGLYSFSFLLDSKSNCKDIARDAVLSLKRRHETK